jgi:hypothetical protein
VSSAGVEQAVNVRRDGERVALQEYSCGRKLIVSVDQVPQVPMPFVADIRQTRAGDGLSACIEAEPWQLHP